MGHVNWQYFLGLISWYPVMLSSPATHLKIGHLSMKSTAARSSNEFRLLHLKIGCQNGSAGNDHQVDMPYWLLNLGPISIRDQCSKVNTLRLRQNGHYFADNIFKCIFLNENVWILLKISLKVVPKVRINNIPALVQIMAWRQPGEKPLSEPRTHVHDLTSMS